MDYYDIVHNVKLPDTFRKEQKLEQLASIIDELLNEDNMPIEVIENKTNEAFQKVKK